MRVAMVVSVFPTLSETFILDQIDGLLARGHEVSVFGRMPARDVHVTHGDSNTTRAKTHYFDAGPRTPLVVATRSVRVLSSDRTRARYALAELVKLARPGNMLEMGRLWMNASKVLETGERFDVVVAHFGVNGLLALRLRQLGVFSAPLASVFHGRDLSFVLERRGRDVYQELFEQGELMLPVSDYFRRRLVDHGCSAERILVQRMGVDLTRFQYQPRSLDAGQPVRILSVCRLVEKKGIEFGMRACARLPESAPSFVWDILGDGPERKKLTRLASQLGLTRRVTLHGAVSRDRVAQMLATHHVFLAPSITSLDGDQEGIPVAIMEAAASGLPVISTTHSGIPELVQDGVTGYLAPERDLDALSAAIARALTQNEHWPVLAHAARREIETHYELNALNDQLANTLTALARDWPARVVS